MGRKSIADQRRTEIIQAFYRCVVAEGFSGASMRKIAAEAGLLPSSLHHYFKDRNEMVEAMVSFYTDKILNDYLTKMSREIDSRRALEKGIDFIFSTKMINRDDTGFFLECLAEARRNPSVQKILASLFKQFRASVLSHLGKHDVFAGLPENQQQAIGAMIVAIHEGAELQWFADSTSICLENLRQLTRTWIQSVLKVRENNA